MTIYCSLGALSVAKRRRLRDLTVGEYVLEGYNSDDRLLLSQFLVSDQSDLDRLEEIGVVYCTVRDEPEGDPVEHASESAGDDALKAAEVLGDEIDNLSDLVKESERTYQQTVEAMEEVVESVHENRDHADELHQLEPYIGEFMDFMGESPSSISVLTQIERFDQSTFDHSVNVSILSLVYGHYKGFDEEELFQLGFGALMHDIGKTKLSRRIIQKEGELTDKEWEIVRKHPEKGHDILSRSDFEEATRKIALQHHEHPDGSGYPDEETDVHPYARIVSVVDVYEALTADRPYRDPMNPLRAYTVLRDEFYDHPETRPILEDLIQCMGLFPVGCLVQLSNDDIGVVLENHPESLHYPLVKIIATGGEESIKDPYDVDLDHVQNQKRVVNNRIYDDTIEIIRVLEFSNVPRMREAIPEFIQKNRSRF